MTRKRISVLLVLLALVVAAVFATRASGRAKLPIEAMTGPIRTLPDPDPPLIPVVAVAPAIGWRAGQTPVAAAGLKVAAFARDLDHPRWLLPLPNGDLLVAESNAPPRQKTPTLFERVQSLVMSRAGAGVKSPNRIVLLRDANGDGVAETRTILAANLVSPYGMALVGDQLYVAEADKLVRFAFRPGQTQVADPVKVVDLPGGPINHHWTKNVIASPDGAKLYVTVGSNSNIGGNGMAAEEGRAAIWEVDAKTGEHRIYAYGLRNPNGLGFEPTSGMLWTVVNERDGLGSDIVPDYLTAVEFGGFYGWPWWYWGGYIDKRVDGRDDMQQQYVRRPDYALGAHTASLGLAFAGGAKLGARFADGAFIGQHGSWNRKPRAGYKVIFVPFAKGKPAGMPVDVLTGFLSADEKAHGRPVGVAIDAKGALLVADDVGNAVWRVTGG
ncbi:MAG: sorbosone dehydrogenase family protein [Sphingomonas sp.]